MSPAEPHPSFLELDRYALQCGDPRTALHVAECERCRAHVAALAPADAAPAWLGTLKPAPARARWRAPGFGLGGLALAAALYLALLRPSEPSSHYIGTKGAPVVAIHVNRAGRVALWDHTPLQPGDRIRLEVAPAEFDYVSVFAVQARASRLSTMYSGRVQAHERTLLPKAWQLDGAPGPERVLVMFSHAQISEQAASALLKAHDPREVSILWLTLPKSQR